jgi:hypothetical protein
MDFTLFHTSAEIEIAQRSSILLASLLAEREYHNGKEFHFSQEIHKMNVEVLVSGMERPCTAYWSSFDDAAITPSSRSTCSLAPLRSTCPCTETLNRR